MSMGFLGDLAVDLTLHIDRYPREGDDGIARTQTRSLGGSVVNTAIVARRLGAPARMFVRLGSDPDGEHSRAEMAAEGLDVTAVQWDDTEPTQTNVTIVTDGGQRTMFAYRGTSRRLTAPTAEQLEGVAQLHVSAYSLYEGEQRRTAGTVIEHIASRGGTVSVDIPAAPPDAALAALAALLPSVALIVGDADDLERLAEAAHASGLDALADTVVVKHGRTGCTVIAPGTHTTVPALAPTVIDTTGAGDAFTAALLVARRAGLPLETAALLANAAGGAATTVVGAGRSFPGLEVMHELLAASAHPAAEGARRWLAER